MIMSDRIDNGCIEICKKFHSHPSLLLRGFNALRVSEKLFDVTLIVEGRKLKAHRVVLAACSDYFCAMFTMDGMTESTKSEIELIGVNAGGMEIILEFIYTSKLDLNSDNVQDVLSVANHVQLQTVIEACSSFLEQHMDLDNCVAIVTMADLYSLSDLKNKTFRYICEYMQEFSDSADVLNMSSSQFDALLSCNYPVCCPEGIVLAMTIKYCLKTNIKIELAELLFAKIRFHQIPPFDTENIIEKMEVIFKNVCTKETLFDYNELIQKEMNKQLDRVRKLSPIEQVDVDNATRTLINSRGMELALIKIGGFESLGLTNAINCYLPTLRKWEPLTAIPHLEQCNYGTAVMRNSLFIVGGSYDVCLKEYIHPFGFCYCPSFDKWSTIAQIQSDRCRFSLNAWAGNYLYAVGGVSDLNESENGSELWAHDLRLSNCERYSAITDSWEYLPPLMENRSQHAGVIYADVLYISGGIDRHIVLSSLWSLNLSNHTWKRLTPMPNGRVDHVLVECDGKIFACGGWNEDLATETRVLAETIDIYDVATDQWKIETQNPMPKYYTGITIVKRKIYFIGGLLSTADINRATNAVQCYDIDTKQWHNNPEWEYPNDIWECTLASLYVPQLREKFEL